jgi:hypothetical protein
MIMKTLRMIMKTLREMIMKAPGHGRAKQPDQLRVLHAGPPLRRTGRRLITRAFSWG